MRTLACCALLGCNPSPKAAEPARSITASARISAAPSAAAAMPHAASAATTASAAKASAKPAPHSAHHFVTLDARDLVEVSLEVKVDEVPSHGLAFFALQMNLAETWAHGGLQRVGGKSYGNWGGLTKAHNYDLKGHELDTLERIQNGSDRENRVDWRTGRWYRYRIARGPEETLPEGDYAPLRGAKVHVGPRRFWRWDFSTLDAETGKAVFNASLHTKAARIESISYWTETGEGMGCDDRIVVHWRGLTAKSASRAGVAIERITKSIRQSTCPDSATTDVSVEDAATHGTRMTFGLPRAPGSHDGQALFP